MTISERVVVSAGTRGTDALTFNGSGLLLGHLIRFPAARGGANSASQLPTHRVLPAQSPMKEDSMKPDAEAADVLDKVADVLFVYGRCTAAGTDDAGRMCVQGALAYAEGLDPREWVGFRSPAYEALRSYIETHPEAHLSDEMFQFVGIALKGNPFVWNDRIVHDDELVIDTVRRCAKELRESAA